MPALMYERLAAWRDRLIATYQKGHMRQWWKGDDGPTFPELIGRMLDWQASKRSRCKRSRRVRRARRLLELMDWQPKLAE